VTFDWQHPDYVTVFQQRLDRLERIRADPTLLPGLMAYYRDHPDDFINDWGVTYDPRNSDVGLPTIVPFVLFPKQREWVQRVHYKWKHREDMLTEKSREVGVSWLSVGTAAAICLTHEGVAIGFGSRKWEYVDKLGSPKSLFWKVREFIKRLPPEFHGGWSERANSVEGRISFPTTGSVITGEAGDGIGRGDRASIYFVDEAAFLERPQLVDAALSATTNCRIDISSANGIGNSFYQKRAGGKIEVFTIHWRDDPRKDDAWYAKQVERLDPVTVAQEIDINYSASATGILIPSAWIQSAVDADKVLGLTMRGEARGALDVADEGVDLNAFCVAVGVVVEDVVGWSGKGDDIFGTVQRAFSLCDEHGITTFEYDADGLGAGVRGDARVINEQRKRKLTANPFRGSGAVFKPDSVIPTAVPGTSRERLERKNGDFFANAKAQAWWELRVRFQRTHRAVTACLDARKRGETWVVEYTPDDLMNSRTFQNRLLGEPSLSTYSHLREPNPMATPSCVRQMAAAVPTDSHETPTSRDFSVSISSRCFHL